MERQKSLEELIDAIGNLGELNLVLKPLLESPLEKWVLKICVFKKSGITTQIPNPTNLIDLANRLHLIEAIKDKNKDVFVLTSTGKKLLNLGYIWEDRLSKNQGKYLLGELVKEKELFQAILFVFNMFHANLNNELWISSKDKRINPNNGRILRVLQQMKIAEYLGENILINKEDREWLIDNVVFRSTLDSDTLLSILQRRKENGAIAEEFVLNYEKTRLKQSGREDLSQLVKKLSATNVGAGYDILSYDGSGSKGLYDRFIEVKGTSGDEVIFFITKNELETAKSYQKKYWIYFVVNVNSNELMKVKIKLNNLDSIFSTQSNYVIEPILWKVRLKNEK